MTQPQQHAQTVRARRRTTPPVNPQQHLIEFVNTVTPEQCHAVRTRHHQHGYNVIENTKLTLCNIIFPDTRSLQTLVAYLE